MFKNFFSWNDSEVFYDEAEPDWGGSTAASQVIQYPTGARPGNGGPAIMTGGAPMMDQREQMRPRQVETPRVVVQQPRVIVQETPRPVIRVDRNEMQPAPMMRVQVPPTLEYKAMEFHVPLCCEGCQDRVTKKLRHRVRGVDSVHCDLHWKKVTVRGYAMPADVLRELKKMFKRSEYWNQRPMMMPMQGPMPVPMPVPTMQQQHAMKKGPHAIRI